MPRLTSTTKARMRAPCGYFSPGACSCGGSTPSTVPRSTWTMWGLCPCWICPETISPSRPLKWPRTASSSTSRSRWRMTWRAVEAAIRPKPAGVSSNSPTASPSSSSSGAQMVTWPVRRSISARAPGSAPAVLWYASRRACSMVGMSRSTGMSRSRSSSRRVLISMSMSGLPHLTAPGTAQRTVGDDGAPPRVVLAHSSSHSVVVALRTAAPVGAAASTAHLTLVPSVAGSVSP